MSDCVYEDHRTKWQKFKSSVRVLLFGSKCVICRTKVGRKVHFCKKHGPYLVKSEKFTVVDQERTPYEYPNTDFRL